MTKLTMTAVEATLLLARTKAAAKGKGRLLDVIMPNGLPLRDCSFKYVGQVGEAIQELGRMMPVLVADPETRH